VTSEAIREVGWAVAGEARTYTTEGLVEALLDLVSSSSGEKIR
jgi:hypothetical protein